MAKEIKVDMKEDRILELDSTLLGILLKDYSTGKNIIWATDDYAQYNPTYTRNRRITVFSVVAKNGTFIKSRIEKTKQEQLTRVRSKGEVFTPLWICNKQNNLIDGAWFGKENVFNTEQAHEWTATAKKIPFPTAEGKTWQDYVKANRLEIACGEAPYLASRYDTLSGEILPVSVRIGLLDRKLRVVSENTQSEEEWNEWATQAIKSVYGYDWQGDNVFLARENLLLTFSDYYEDKFGRYPDRAKLREIALILSRNIWQMDGLKFVVPNSCCGEKSFLWGDESHAEECEGCKKNDPHKHRGKYCYVTDWDKNRKIRFASLLGKKPIAFDAIVGNPPYQMMDGGAQASSMPIYHGFVEAAKSMEPSYLSLITPARWYAGGKGLDAFRTAMLSDRRMAQLVDYSNSADCFPAFGNRGIKGGICYFLWSSRHDGKCRIRTYSGTECTSESTRFMKEEGCEIFLRDAIGVSILNKVKAQNEPSFETVVSARKPFGFPTNFNGYTKENTGDGQVKLYANKAVGYVERSEVLKNAEWVDAYKLYIPEAIGNADVANDRLKSIVGIPGTCCTETYLVIGPFENEAQCANCNSYIDTRFFHFLLSLKKITQHTTQKCYGFVPLQNFNERWDDEKLFKKYALTSDEIAYINATVWPKR